MPVSLSAFLPAERRRAPPQPQDVNSTWRAWQGWCVALWALTVSPLALAAQVSDCQGPASAVLRAEQPLGSEVLNARAAWLDGKTLRWAGQPSQGVFKLYSSRSAQLRIQLGQPVRGGDQVLRLQSVAARSPGAEQAPDSVRRFSHIGPGATLALRGADAPRLNQMLRGQTVVTREDASGRVLAATHVQVAGALDALYASAQHMNDLGSQIVKASSRRGGHTRFAVWAPTALTVHLCAYNSSAHNRTRLIAMKRDARTGAWHAQLPGSRDQMGYSFLVDVHVRGAGVVRNRVTDPYALGLNANSQRSVVADLTSRAWQPPQWGRTARPNALASATDLVIYELHVRDFSAQDLSVPPAHRGKYLAFTHESSRGMQHLHQLAQAGVTDVHLLPVFDLATVPEAACITPDIAGLRAQPDSEQQQAAVAQTQAQDCFNWGYDPWHYTVPEGSYATDAHDAKRRVIEFRQMVQALHRAGLRVGMDVVYNHTTASGQHPQSVLDRIVPGYYHRLNAQGEVERSTCCDNTATEHLMMGKLMIDSAVVWARDYGIDSFRFDLMGHQPRAAMEQLQRAVNRASGRHIHLIGEGWDFGEVQQGQRFVQASQQSLNGSGIATFNDRGRDALRGGGCCDGGADVVLRQGWVNGLGYAPNEAVNAAQAAGLASFSPAALSEALHHSADLVRLMLAGTLRQVRLTRANGTTITGEQLPYGDAGAGFVAQPIEVVNYIENHDNPTLFDINVMKLPLDTSGEDRARVQHLGQAVVALSQGVAYFHAGQEILRSKSLDRNSFDSGDWFNRLDWTYQDNGFGAGLPPKGENASVWEWMRPRLADARIKPSPEQIDWTRRAFLDVLRIRASTTLLRLRTAEDVVQRLRFLKPGPTQAGSVIAAHLDGRGYAGAGYSGVVILLNADVREHTVGEALLSAQAWQLHPVHSAPEAADKRAALSRFDAQRGEFTVPPRTAVVWVLP